MKHCAKKLLGLAFALALCLAVGGIALAETPEQEVLAYEQNVTTAAGTNIIDKLATEGYQVTIPTTVDVKSGETKGELKVTAQLKQWRTLNIGIESKKNNWKLAYDGATGADTPKVDYTLKNENENGGESTRDTIWYYDEDTHEIMYATSAVENFHTATIPLSVNVTNPSQATMSGTYSDTLTFTFNITKQSVTYTINVYEQKLELTNSGTHVQAVNVVDANGNVTDTTSVPKETYVLEYGCADAWGTPLATAVTSETWTRTRPADDNGEDERCWEDLSRTLTPKADFDANNKTQTINLNLVRKWYWLDVNSITDKDTCTKCETDGNQGGKIASFVNIKVSVDDGTNWSDWFWYPGGDDYWGTFPYGTEFQLGLHRVKDGYAYDADDNGNVAIYANGVLTHTQDTAVSPDGKTHYRVYQGKLKGEPVDETLYDTKGGGISHAAGSYPRYCYNVCFVDGITYYANGGTGGREDTNLYHGAHTTFKYTAGMTLAAPLNDEITGCKFTAPDGKVFAGWSTTPEYTAGQTLYAVNDPVSSVTWPTRPTISNNDTLPTGDGQTVCRTLYAIWKKPYTVKVQFGGDIGWTDWDDTSQTFPESEQDGDKFDDAVALGTAYAYGNTSLTLSETENKTVWDELQAKINAKTKDIAGVAQPNAVWQLKNKYTFTTLPANGEVTIQIKRKRYLLNVIPALLLDDGHAITPAGDIATAKQYGKFDLYSCGKPQTLGGKISYYQYMRNYGGSYHINNVEANAGYRFVGFRVIQSNAPVDKSGPSYSEKLTGKDYNISHFKDNTTAYEGDTIYVVFKEDVVTFDFNGGKNQEGETKTEVQYDPDSFIPVMYLRKDGSTSSPIGWSLNKEETQGEVIYHSRDTQLKDIPWLDSTDKVLYARWSTGPNRAPAKKALTVHYHANFDPNEELALDLDPNPLLEDMDEDFGFAPDPLPEDVLDPTVEAVKIVTYKPDENVVLRNCMFKRAGYVFVGWNTEPDGTGKKYEVNGVPITDWAAGTTVDLYAQWKKPEHLKPVVDSEPFVPADPDTPPERIDDGFDAAFGADPDPLPEGMDDAFGIDPDPLPEGLDDAFGV